MVKEWYGTITLWFKKGTAKDNLAGIKITVTKTEFGVRDGGGYGCSGSTVKHEYEKEREDEK